MTVYSMDLRERVFERILTWRSDHFTRKADRVFREVCGDPPLVEYVVSLPLGGLPEIRRALSEDSHKPGQGILENAVRTAVKRDWRQLSLATVNRAANTYALCLKCVLSDSRSVCAADEQNVQTGTTAHQTLDAHS